MNVITSRQSLDFVCHPLTPCPAVTAIHVAIAVTGEGGLLLDFVLQGDLSGVRIPAPRPSRRMDGLWRHTCFEAFMMADAGPAYREFNFAPSGAWAAYAFRDYRAGGAAIAGAAPLIDVRGGDDRLALAVQIPGDCLPQGGSLRLGLSAVVECVDGALSCWALRHPVERPDFHHPDSFALKLATRALRDTDTRTVGAGS